MIHRFDFLQDDETYYFDPPAVSRVVSFIETFCKLADPYGEPFILLPWQRQILNDVFGYKRRDNQERRFNYVWIEVPRKNGKTYFVAALLLYLLLADGQPCAEVYAAAATREQSSILYKSACRMRSQSEFLSSRLSPLPYRSELHYKKGDGILKALSGENVGQHGKYVSAVAFDEVHELTSNRSEQLFDALTTAFGNRKSPLVLMTTTAGFGSQPTLAKRMHEKALSFMEGTLEDPTFYGVVYGATLEDDWKSEAVWKAVNPSWELARKNLHKQFIRASSEPSYENTFRRLFLNQWTAQNTRWLDGSLVQRATQPLAYADLKGKELILGLDLSEIYDLTAIALLYPSQDKWRYLVRCFMPRQQIARRSREDNIPYDLWERQGHLIATDGISQGQTVDYPTIIEEIKTLALENDLRVVAYDPSKAVNVIPQLHNLGINTLSVSPKHKEMSPASKEFERRLTSEEIILAENPCMAWQLGNVEVVHNSFGDIMPTKPQSQQGKGWSGQYKYKVDGVVASIIATQAALLYQYKADDKENNDNKPSVYFV